MAAPEKPKIGAERQAADQREVKDQPEEVDDQDQRAQQRPPGGGGGRSPARQRGLSRRGEQGQAERDLEIQEPRENAQIPGQRHEGELPPAASAVQHLPEHDPPQGRKHDRRGDEQAPDGLEGEQPAQRKGEQIHADVGQRVPLQTVHR